ncbi:hypothetical protein [Pseudanabaena sp. PCC 6802]|uniref:hypothetical protein n=1 Tax=Pseudanabaena sp. PCC 6802 TaxID=118173 RepID=UPI0003448BB1|nr:hypothetical protein [Pseudanabaena sp. PCC 6802]
MLARNYQALFSLTKFIGMVFSYHLKPTKDVKPGHPDRSHPKNLPNYDLFAMFCDRGKASSAIPPSDLSIQ